MHHYCAPKGISNAEKDRLADTAVQYQKLLHASAKDEVEDPEKAYIRRIAVKSIGKTVFINVDHIVLIGRVDQYVEVSTEKKRFTVRESMDKLEKTLIWRSFFVPIYPLL